MIYQFFLIVGFIGSATSMIRSIDTDLWVVPIEAQAFAFSATIRREYLSAVAGADRVADAAPVITVFANAINEHGVPSIISLAGLPVERFKRVSGDRESIAGQAAESDRGSGAKVADWTWSILVSTSHGGRRKPRNSRFLTR